MERALQCWTKWNSNFPGEFMSHLWSPVCKGGGKMISQENLYLFIFFFIIFA